LFVLKREETGGISVQGRFPLPCVEWAAAGGTTGGYLHLTPERLRKPAQQVEDKLLRMAKVKPSAEIVAFPVARGGGEA
jgi:hypothetical protein